MGNRTYKFLIGSVIITAIVCISVFAFITNYSKNQNEQLIDEVGTLYMEEMNSRIAEHFATAMELRISQLENIVNSVAYSDSANYEEFISRLGRYANSRGFEGLSLYSEDGEFQHVSGMEFDVFDKESFNVSMKHEEDRGLMAMNEQGDIVLVFGVAADYPMEDGKTAIAIAGSVPTDEFSNMLTQTGNNQLVYSHVIRYDGMFVAKGADVLDDNNYFEHIRRDFGDQYAAEAELYIGELQNALDENTEYSKLLYLDGTRRQMFCTPLRNAMWFMLTVMPYGKLDEIVNNTNQQWVRTVLISSSFIVIVFVVIFIIYFDLAKKHIKQLEISRQQALDATKAKSEFLSNMSHDIRTPMNAIVGMTAIATANISDKQQVQECLKKITLSSKHLLGLINDILDMSKIESGKMTLNMEQVSLREVMDSMVSIVQPQVKTKRQHFDVFISDIQAEDVFCDSVRLNQVLLNLISNAIKFTPDEGDIHVSLYEEDSPVGDTHVRVHLIVKDSGIGMSDEFKSKVFESFAREDRHRVHKTEGTGLGMAIAKYIVTSMGGTIEVQSEQGKGTEFHVTLDLEKAAVREEEMILPEMNMLLVDDDRQLCEGAVSSLKEIGLKADWTLDGESAVEMVKQRHNDRNDYQVILLDWKLPGIDGIETARRIRNQTGGEIPILLISAYDWSEIEIEAREAGISGFISKPLFKSTLYYGLKRFIGTDAEQAEAEDIRDEAPDFSGKHILLAEDNDLNWEIAEALLSELGLEIDRAENGLQCVEMFTKSEEGFYNAILMDIRMPIMTGYEASRKIRKLERSDKDIPIIAMTADAFAEDVQKCIDSGMNAHVSKPIDVTVVARLLEQYMK